MVHIGNENLEAENRRNSGVSRDWHGLNSGQTEETHTLCPMMFLIRNAIFSFCNMGDRMVTGHALVNDVELGPNL